MFQRDSNKLIEKTIISIDLSISRKNYIHCKCDEIRRHFYMWSDNLFFKHSNTCRKIFFAQVDQIIEHYRNINYLEQINNK